MKYVFNEEKNEKMRHILMMQPTEAEGKALVEKDESDAEAWYVYATALGLNQKVDEAIDAYSHGIACDPFYAPNYFGRSRKYNGQGKYWASMADLTMSVRLDENNWIYWYYKATTQNLAGHLEESIDDFKMCLKCSAPHEHFPLVDWIYNTYAELGQYEEAEKSLDLVDANMQEPQMDYGYARAVRLCKGLIKPEDYIDIPLMEKKVLPRENRVQLELNGMYFTLYNYWMVHHEPEKAADAIRELQKVAYPGAFGYTKSIPIAKKLGIIK